MYAQYNGEMYDVCFNLKVTQEESGMVIIWGQRLNTVDSPKIEFCGHPCQLDKQSADTIRCKMASMAASCQNISLHGKLGAVPDFHFHQALSKQQQLDDNKIHPRLSASPL